MSVVTASKSLSASPVPNRIWLTVAIICLAAGIAGVMQGGITGAFIPLALAVALATFFHPVFGLYALIVSLFFPYPIIPNSEIIASDLLVVLVIFSYWLRCAIGGKTGLTRTSIDLPLLVWAGILAFSLLNAGNLGWGLVHLRHHVILFLFFYVVVGLGDPRLAQKLVWLIVCLAALLAVPNILIFLKSGGLERAFGIAKLHYSGLLSLAIVYLTALFCFERSRTKAGFLAALLTLTLAGQVANQSRGALAMTAIGVAAVIIAAWRWSSRNDSRLPRRRILTLTTTGLAVGFLAVLMLAPILGHFYDRLLMRGFASATIYNRFFLWEAAIKIYLQNPILGIGLGQFKFLYEVLPMPLHLNEFGRISIGMSAHNSFLGYLAETGTLGGLALLWVMTRVVRQGNSMIRAVHSTAVAGPVFGVWGVIILIIIRTFFEDDAFHSIPGITALLFFGLMVNMTRQLTMDSKQKSI